MVYLGIFVASVACVGLHDLLLPACAPAFVVIGGATIVPSLPLWYGRWPRPMRDVLRLGMGITFVLCGFLFLSDHVLLGTTGAIVIAAFWKIYLTLRRQRRRNACSGCTELRDVGVCSGYARQADLIRQYEIAATELVMASGTVRPMAPDPRTDVACSVTHQCGTSLRDVEEQEPACPPRKRPACVKDDVSPLLNSHETPANSLVPHVAERRATLEAAMPGTTQAHRMAWSGVGQCGRAPPRYERLR